ncbi:class I adenylate-forming enzyme family protein [Pseudorhodoferax sp. Leaf274]|uniref:class I adenylate-forming enzyme family protein n=1 Tax=Pseudorhodoferax sp. Leaf274 TaxID=1736318 RepID=UPI0007039108|nr:long-chain-fatty-acid--CoA ligase [Pseudorhodoferax sp. Leaf274]KQP45491.1 hypothetical protein ASF44_25315 [Pseudorhodoferax sp. Leaf274]
MQLTQSLHKARREHPDRTATICGARRQTYAELFARVQRLAGALRRLGVQPGDRLGVLCGNTDRCLEAFYAAWWAGAILHPINLRLSPEELGFVLEDSDTRVLLADDAALPLMAAARARIPQPLTAVYLGEERAPAGFLDGHALPQAASALPDARAGGEQPAVLFYTGGTTGRAKGVVLTHAGLYASTLASVCVAGRAPGVVCLHALPMFHVGGMAVVLQAMACADTQLMLPVFHPDAFLDLIAHERVVEAALVPTMLRRVLDAPAFGASDLSSLQRLFYGASPIDGTLLAQTVERMPGVELTQFYGMTETSGIAVALPHRCHTAQGRAQGFHLAAGLATPCCEVRIVDADGDELPTGRIGEIELRGPGVMQGYWRQPELTAQALHDGWMRTGDAGRLDAHGLLYIVDRLKDMIVTGGENVYSVEVEAAVLSLPGVAQCAVFGVPDAQWGERVHAVLVLQAGAQVDEAAVIAHCRPRIAGYKCPRSVEFRSEMPVSGAGKLLKYRLRAPYWEGQARRVG